jgi:hypothetical protein
MLKTVYGESTMSKSNVKWHKRFREGRDDVNDERQGIPTTK